jgi:hypothetical protein
MTEKLKKDERCDIHPNVRWVVAETDEKTGRIKRMCQECWNEHRGRK